MNLQAFFRHIAVKVTLMLTCLVALSSCNDLLYEEEGDCTVYYRITFRYDMNLKWSDAFANEVSSVHLYAFDSSGVLVWHQDERVDPENAENYYMLIELPAGDYQMLAWCGLSNDGEHDESFTVPDVRIGQTRMADLQCAMARERDESGAFSKERLYRLFHGRLDVSLPANDDGGVYDYTMYLTKDTNHVRIVLQHLSGEDVDVNDFTFRIEDENGLLAHDNELLDDENITYHPWKLQNSEAGLDKDDEPAESKPSDTDTRALVYTKGAIADLTVGRMMKSHQKRMMLTINNKEGERVARVPVIDYALMAKEYYEEEYNKKMTDQEFLDREDEYVMTFFLDENNKWISSQILIHSWIVILDDVEIES